MKGGFIGIGELKTKFLTLYGGFTLFVRVKGKIEIAIFKGLTKGSHCIEFDYMCFGNKASGFLDDSFSFNRYLIIVFINGKDVNENSFGIGTVFIFLYHERLVHVKSLPAEGSFFVP